MQPVKPAVAHDGARFVEFGANQPQYDPLPAYVDPQGVVLTEWELSAEDLAHLLDGGRLRLWIITGESVPMQSADPTRPDRVHLLQPVALVAAPPNQPEVASN